MLVSITSKLLSSPLLRKCKSKSSHLDYEGEWESPPAGRGRMRGRGEKRISPPKHRTK